MSCAVMIAQFTAATELYACFQDRELSLMSSDIFDVYERSVRNVPWCTELWLGYVRAAERHERSHNTVKGENGKGALLNTLNIVY